VQGSEQASPFLLARLPYQSALGILISLSGVFIGTICYQCAVDCVVSKMESIPFYGQECDYLDEILENGIVIESSRYKSEVFESETCELSSNCDAGDSLGNKSAEDSKETETETDVNTSSVKEESHSDDLSSILEDVQSLRSLQEPCKQSNR
jgi:hypothetical protein